MSELFNQGGRLTKDGAFIVNEDASLMKTPKG